MSILDLNKVSYSYPNGNAALDEIDLSLSSGDRLAIVGQNGAGKTTLAKLMNGLLKPTSGTVLVNGVDTKTQTTAQLARSVVYVFQNPDDQIFNNTVFKEVSFGPRVLGYEDVRIGELTQKALVLCGLEGLENVNPYDLPLALRKFVSIAAVISMDSDIYVFDEPTAGQDVLGVRRLEAIMDELTKENKTVITITHDMDFVSRNFSRVAVMAHANLLRVATPQEIFSDVALLKEAMLIAPYASRMARALNLKDDVLSISDLANAIQRRLQ